MKVKFWHCYLAFSLIVLIFAILSGQATVMEGLGSFVLLLALPYFLFFLLSIVAVNAIMIAAVFILPIRFIKEAPEELVAHGWPHWLAVAFCILVGLLGMVMMVSLLGFPLRV